MQGNEACGQSFVNGCRPSAIGLTRTSGEQTHFPFRTPGGRIIFIRSHRIAGISFIQDEIEYDTRTHHSNMDVFRSHPADDMKQAATIMAAFVYQTAMRRRENPAQAGAGEIGVAQVVSLRLGQIADSSLRRNQWKTSGSFITRTALPPSGCVSSQGCFNPGFQNEWSIHRNAVRPTGQPVPGDKDIHSLPRVEATRALRHNRFAVSPFILSLRVCTFKT